MAGLGMVEESAVGHSPILAINSGSSSLKFGVYNRGVLDEPAVADRQC
jgi:hypothetical protein